MANLGDYERLAYTTEDERKRADAQINSAADQLCRAAGVFDHLAKSAIPEWERVMGMSVKGRPVDLTREVCSALSR